MTTGARGGMLALAASLAILLVGCSESPPLPKGPTVAEVEAILEHQRTDQWEMMFPGEPEPVVEPVLFVPADEQVRHLMECVGAQNLPGVQVTPQQTSVEEGSQRAFERAFFICGLQYPVIITDPESMGIRSEAQLEYLYDYYSTRLVPCLEVLGFTTSRPPTNENFAELGYSTWYPYFDMVPMPVSAREWHRIDYHCPPPPFGGERPGAVG